ncbi:13898_t:CDS:1, partial [Funneliformis geosporum]
NLFKEYFNNTKYIKFSSHRKSKNVQRQLPTIVMKSENSIVKVLLQLPQSRTHG